VSFNDFEEKHPLVSLGFSWGFMGHWPTDLVNNAKAGAVTGWDWLTHPFIDAPSIGSMFLTMCDTSRTTPFTIQQWFGGIPTQYYDETSYHDFNLLYSGSNDFTLWIPLKITSISPSAALPGETVSILGAGFGSTKDKIFFGSASATDISLWTDGRIETKVPDNLPDGEVLVFVEVGCRRSNSVPFTVGIDLLSLLRTCDYLGFEIQAPHVFTSGAPDFEIFDRVFVPLVWDGANFTFDQIFGFSITSLSGSVSSDGHFLSMEWTFYNEERYGNEIVSYRTNESASVRNLPFTSYRVIFGSPYIEYLVTGADAAQYVQTLYFNDYQYDYDGNMTAYNQYVSTNWQAPGETIELECWFTRY